MFVTKSRTSIALFTFLSQIHLFGATLTIGTSSAEVKTSDFFSITCHVSDLSDAVVFYKGTIEIGRCAKSVIPGLPGLCVAGFAQDISTNITTYTITSANATINDGLWTCQHTTETSNTLTLIVYGFPNNPVDDNQAYLPNKIDTTNMDSTQFTVNVSECVNPAPTISWTFYQACDGTSITPISISSTSSEDPDVVCSSPYSAYKSTVTVTDMKKKVDGDYCLKVRASVEYPETSFMNETRLFTQNITFTSKVSKEVDDKTDELLILFTKVIPSSGAAIGGSARLFPKYTVIMLHVVLFGNVVNGIQLVLVSAVINTVTIIFGVVVLVCYYGKYKCITILYFILLVAASSVIGVLINMAILILFGSKEFIHIKFKNKEESKKLSALGLKLTNDNPIIIYFKVKAINACITLHIIEHMKDLSVVTEPKMKDLSVVTEPKMKDLSVVTEPKIRKLEMVLLRNGCPPRKLLIDPIDDSRDLLLSNASYTEYKSCYLKCENKTITVFDEKEKEILQWTSYTDSFIIGDIEISNKKQDDSTKDDSTEEIQGDDSTKDDSIEIEQGEKLETPAEWFVWFRKEKLETPAEQIFWFRKGYSSFEIPEDSRCKILLLIFVIVIPIAWLVMIGLILKNCLESKGKNTDDIESESKVKKTDDIELDTKGKRFDFASVSCCANSVKPNSTKDNQPKAIMPGSYLANSPKGRNLPKLHDIVKPEDETRKTKKKDKKKKKIKIQDSNKNDKQQSHSLKQDITFQSVIAVVAGELKAE